MKTILHTVDTGASPQSVFDAIAKIDGLASWWTATVQGEAAVGGVINFRFGTTFNPDMKILEFKPPRRVAWTCIDGHDPWLDAMFQFEIEPRSPGSVLFFRQDYARELSDEEYGRYNFNWGYYLESLRRFVETGRGWPYNTPAETIERPS